MTLGLIADLLLEVLIVGGEDRMIAPCGLNCGACDIFRAPGDPETMKRILRWFEKERGLKLREEDVRCDGCLGDRSKHWSADCWILRCSVDDNGLRSCAECSRFPCARLEEWAGSDDGYRKALERLKSMV
ncbi:MAG: DUF3795 domain-containing protein [Betaproteobacteria bacterium]